jgi:elongation factor G
MAFQMAGGLGLRDAAGQSQVLLLEPVDEVAVLVDDEHVGTIMGDLSSRRGHVVGTEPVGSGSPDGGGRTLVRAEVPQLEIVRYAIDLRSMSHGTGTFTRSYARHDPMPPQLAAKVQAEHAS